MLGIGWLTIRQAQEALKNGRLEEAHRLLGQSAAAGHKRSWELLQQVAVGFVERGERHLRQRDTEAAWNDLLLAEQVGLADDSAAVGLRQLLTRQGLEEVRKLLEAGDPIRAAAAVEALRGRSVRGSDLQLLETAAQDWLQARDLAERGEFNMALLTVERLRRQLPELTALQRGEQELTRRREVCKSALIALHEAMDGGHWRKVVEVADQVLAVAPQHAQARKARSQAWRAIEPPTVASVRPAAPRPVEKPAEPLERFMLWIDGVGGYLVCLGNRLSLGQATSETSADVGFYADISRVHASILRDGSTYMVEGGRPVQVNSQSVEKAVLQPGDRVTLGTACQLQFSQPVPVSASARLDLASGHRLALAVDAVLLMADTLVLGPGTQVHVSLPELSKNAVLYRTKEGLGVRYPGTFSVDGQKCTDRAVLGPNSRVVLEEYTFAVEVVGPRFGTT
jgi:hypothetical protein